MNYVGHFLPYNTFYHSVLHGWGVVLTYVKILMLLFDKANASLACGAMFALASGDLSCKSCYTSLSASLQVVFERLRAT